MKISKKEQDKVRGRIITAFVALVTEKGFRKTTMGAVAKAADIGGSTIYNYFKSKEQILFAQKETMLQQAVRQLKQIEDLGSYQLQERLQVYFDLILEVYEEHRDFVIEAQKQIALTPFSFVAEIKSLKEVFGGPVHEAMEAAIESGEIPHPPLRSFLESLIGDYFHGLVHYWSEDDSEDRSKSLQLSDLSLGLGVSLLKSGAINKGLDLLQFLFKRHMHSLAGLLGNIASASHSGCNCDCHKGEEK